MASQTALRIDADGCTVRALLRRGADRLVAAGLAGGARDAEVLLGRALGVERAELIACVTDAVDAGAAAAYEDLLRRRVEREPVAYILGRREFWSLEFRVTPDVLIPRPETELLVELALQLARRTAAPHPWIADIGTGSGAIAVALARELSSTRVVATELSIRALGLASINARRHQVAGRIEFIESDLFAGLAPDARFDLIVSNPPYIRADEIARLEPDVACWEPRAALDGGADGLDFYRRFAREAPGHLARAGALVLEIGAGMAPAVTRAFEQTGGWDSLSVHTDYAGIERAVIARWRGSR